MNLPAHAPAWLRELRRARFTDVRQASITITPGGGAEPWNRVVEVDAVFADADGKLCRVRILGMAHEAEIRVEELDDANTGGDPDSARPGGVLQEGRPGLLGDGTA